MSRRERLAEILREMNRRIVQLRAIHRISVYSSFPEHNYYRQKRELAWKSFLALRSQYNDVETGRRDPATLELV